MVPIKLLSNAPGSQSAAAGNSAWAARDPRAANKRSAIQLEKTK